MDLSFHHILHVNILYMQGTSNLEAGLGPPLFYLSDKCDIASEDYITVFKYLFTYFKIIIIFKTYT